MTARQLLKKMMLPALAALGPQRWPSSGRRLLVLTYHRILPSDDPRYALEQPGMIVTPQTFARQMDWLINAGFQFTHISEWLNCSEQKQKHGKWCAITFDDGWQDNYAFAFPILQNRKIPFQIYVVANRCDGTGDYWPGRLARLLAFMIERHTAPEQLNEAQWLTALLPSRLTSAIDRDWIDQVIVACKKYPEDFIYPALEKIEQQLPEAETDSVRPLLNEAEIKEMLATGLLQLGCHTANHVRLLPTLSDEVLLSEVVRSRDDLEKRFAGSVTSFCYPNGDYSPAALALVRKHYSCAVTTISGWNTVQSDPFELRRISMHEDATNTSVRFWSKLSGWI